MKGSILVILLIMTVKSKVLHENVKRCPTMAERRFVHPKLCNDTFVYHCLLDDENKLVETCNKFIQLPPGNYPRYTSFADRIYYEECPEGEYQPWPRKSNEIAICELVKSTCNGIGQVPCGSGTTTTDVTCGCDYKMGYVINGPDRCCSPSESEDCHCQYQPCQDESKELNSDYNCVDKCPNGYERLPGQRNCTILATSSGTFHNNTVTVPTTFEDEKGKGPTFMDVTSIIYIIGAGLVICLVSLIGLWYFGDICRPYKLQLYPFIVLVILLVICFIVGIITVQYRLFRFNPEVIVTLLMLAIFISTFYAVYLLTTYKFNKDRITYNEEYEVMIFKMLQAAAKGDLYTLEKFRNQLFIDMFGTDYDKRSALHLAACEGQIKAVKFLLEINAGQLESKDRCMGHTPVQDAIWHKEHATNEKQRQNLDEVIKLLKKGGRNSKPKQSYREEIALKLINAAQHGDEEELVRLHTLETVMNLSNSSGRTALHTAVENGQIECVKVLLDVCNVSPFVRMGTDKRRPLDLVKEDDEDMRTILQKAIDSHLKHDGIEVKKIQQSDDKDVAVVRLLNCASRGDIRMLKGLKNAGYDMELADYDKHTALHIAASDNQEHVVEFLLKQCNQINMADTVKDRWNNTPLMIAKQRGKRKIFNIFLENCPNLINTESDEYKTFSLLTAGKEGDVDKLKQLYDSGYDMNKQDYDGRTALHLAAAEWKFDAVKFLLYNCRCNTQITDRDGRTPNDEITSESKRKDFKTMVFSPITSLSGESDTREQFISSISEGKAKKYKRRFRSRIFSRQKSNDMQLSSTADDMESRKINQAIDQSHMITLFESAAKGDLQALKGCKYLYYDLDDYMKNTPLHVAAVNGHKEIVKYLVEKHCVSPFVRDNLMKTPVDLVKEKLDILVNHRERTDLNLIQSQRYTSVRNYLDEKMEKMIETTDIEADKTFEKYNKDVQTFMFLNKTYKGDIRAVKRYIKTDKSIVNRTDYDQRSALHIAVAERHEHLVKYFLDDNDLKGYIVFELKDRWGKTPKDEAIENKFQELVDMFDAVTSSRATVAS